MRVTTIYTPADSIGQDINFKYLYTLTDLQKLAEDLVAAGVTNEDVLSFQVDHVTGALTVVHEKTV